MSSYIIYLRITKAISESENLYDWQAQLDKADLEMQRRRGGLNFQRRRLPAFFCKDDDIVFISSNSGSIVLRSIIFVLLYN